MKAIIPVAGVGERLKPFTHTTPKPLLSMAGKPILAHIIDRLLPQGVDELVLVVGYLGERIEEFVRKRYDLPIHIVWQDRLLGLGYAVYVALGRVADDEPFLVILGDTIIEADLSRVIGSRKNIIGITRVDDPRRFGVVELSGTRIIGMEEKPAKPKSNWVIAGVYHFGEARKLREALEYVIENDIRTRGEIQLTDALARMLEDGVVFEGLVIDGWYDCGKPETLLQTHRHLLEHHGNITELSGSIVIPPVYVAASAVVESCVLGPYVSVGEGAKIRRSIIRDSIVGDGATLCNCILENSIIGNDAAFYDRPHRLNLGDSSRVELEW